MLNSLYVVVFIFFIIYLSHQTINSMFSQWTYNYLIIFMVVNPSTLRAPKHILIYERAAQAAVRLGEVC